MMHQEWTRAAAEAEVVDATNASVLAATMTTDRIDLSKGARLALSDAEVRWLREHGVRTVKLDKVDDRVCLRALPVWAKKVMECTSFAEVRGRGFLLVLAHFADPEHRKALDAARRLGGAKAARAFVLAADLTEQWCSAVSAGLWKGGLPQ